jgi:hypothetical protein
MIPNVSTRFKTFLTTLSVCCIKPSLLLLLYNEKCRGGLAGAEFISVGDDEPDSSLCRGGLAGGGVNATGVADSSESIDVSVIV